MATEENTIPVISITKSEDSNNQEEISRLPIQPTPEPLTDIEDLENEFDQPRRKSMNRAHVEDGGLTDAEVMEASDDEKDSTYVPSIPFKLDDIIDYGGTHEEFVRTTSPKFKQSKERIESRVTASRADQLGGFLNTFYEKDGVTDNEDFDLSDEEDNVDEDPKEVPEEEDILNKLIDDETINISDVVRKSPVPSPSITPEPGEHRRLKKGKGNKKSTESRTKKSNYNLLSPRSLSPHLSDITDTEIVYSDSEEESFTKQRPMSPQERRRRIKQLKGDDRSKSKQKVVKARLPQDTNIFPELEISSVHISEKVPVNELVSESDTDNTNSIPRKHVLYAPKKKTLLMEVAGALMKDTFASTDVEHFEGSNESDDDAGSQLSDYNYNVVDGQYGAVKEKEISKDALRLPKQDKIMLTDTEDIETEDETARMDEAAIPSIKVLSRGASTEEDEFEITDKEYLAAVKELRARAWKESNYEIRFIEIEGQTRPLAITPDLPRKSSGPSLLVPPTVNIYSTDTEDLDGESDVDMSKSLLYVNSPDHDGGITDTETFEGEEEIYRPKSPEPSDDEDSQLLPEPTREMILMKEDPSGRPVSVVLPLGNAEPGGLTAPQVELEGGISEIEDMVTDDDDVSFHTRDPCLTPEISDIEGEIIHTSEVMKVQKKKLKVLGDGLPEPLTDTEDLFLSVSGKRKRSKAKLKIALESRPNDIRQDVTDTEDLVFSDADNPQQGMLSIPHDENDPVTDVDDVDVSGEEEIMQDFQRSSAVTPDHLKELGDSYTTLKEGSGPFTEEARQNFLSLSSIPTINTISPSPDIQFTINTDTEDMVTSADEDGFSRAETMTPYDAGLELEDHSSYVYMKHTRKFDLDAPEEAMHVKGAIDITEANTDVEDLGMSEDERPRPPEQLSVNDTVDQVCVCLNSEVEGEESVCVCVNKEHGGLSLVWNSKNSTDTKQHRDWADKGKPDSTIELSKKESEEALLDMATGLHDTKGSSSDSGPSSAK
uniref:Uncharacterized protein n=1 Tax=Homalodisca liturata TaxID=320908 RepID=A0A1B6JHT6_9HEMI